MDKEPINVLGLAKTELNNMARSDFYLKEQYFRPKLLIAIPPNCLVKGL